MAYGLRYRKGNRMFKTSDYIKAWILRFLIIGVGLWLFINIK